MPARDYTDCDSQAELTHSGAEPIGLPYGAANGQVEVTAATADRWEIVAHSDSGNDFTIAKDSTGHITHDCTAHGDAGCPSGGDW